MKNFPYKVVLLNLIFLFSCTESSEIIPEKSISVDEVRQFLNQTKSSNGRQSSTDIIWDLAAYRDISIGDALLFPVENNNFFVSDENSAVKLPLSSSQFAFAYKIDDDIQVEYVQPVPTGNSSLFTGYYLISDENGHVKRFLEFDQGQFIQERKVVDYTNSSGRSNSSSCFEVTYFECTETSVEGNVISTHCDNAGTSTVCVQDEGIFDDEPIDPNDYGGGGTTGGGGTPSGGGSGGNNGGNPPGGGGPVDDGVEYCPHPFVPELMIVCDAPLCGEGYSTNELGECIINQLTDPCLIAVADKILNPELNSIYNNLIQDIFNSNEEVNLILVEHQLFVGTTHYGQTLSPVIKDGIMNITVRLNPDLDKTTNEFIAAIVYHEIFHAIVNYYDPNGDNYTSLDEHIALYNNYLSLLSNALGMAYPSLSSSDATGLVLWGVINKDGIENSVADEIIDKKGFSRGDLISIKLRYSEKISGTSCD